MRAPTLLGVTDLAIRFAARAPFRRCARAVVVQFGAITLSGSPVSRLGDVDDERRQAKRNSLADKLTVEAKILAEIAETDLGPPAILRHSGRRGSVTVAVGFLLMLRIGPNHSYWLGVLPAMVVIALGMGAA
jgi:hypothetical protein